ncbi:hypothetical protein ACGFJT_37400 [Actinomadura geliboluensis]|uniref:hypothetical protein n=1 Tax=Actinomadura geliboluensis TaxID=882440 RepID=UPI00371A21AB
MADTKPPTTASPTTTQLPVLPPPFSTGGCLAWPSAGPDGREWEISWSPDDPAPNLTAFPIVGGTQPGTASAWSRATSAPAAARKAVEIAAQIEAGQIE